MNKILCFLVFEGIVSGGCSKGKVSAPPNIIYVMTDQQAFDAMSCAGNELVNTPALDKLAASGLRFENAYCAFSLCVPSRAAMFTGKMPHESGIFVNTKPVKDERLPFTILGRLLKDAGYQTHYIGKWHLTVPLSDTAQHGFIGIDHPGAHGFDAEYARQAVNFLNEKHEDPFFLVVSLVNPHDACQLARGEDLSLWEGPIPDLPNPDHLPELPANFEIPENEPDYLRKWQEENSEKVYNSYHWNEQEFKAYQWGYYRLVEKVDSLLAKVFDAANAPYLRDNTLIIFSSDHGDGSSRHRWNQKTSPYDESVRVPFIMAGAPVHRKGETESRLISAGLDLFPTICDFAGIEPPGTLRGRSLRPLVEKNPTIHDWRKYVVTEMSFGNWVNEYHTDTFPKARVLRTDDYKYIVYDRGQLREQLIDMRHDPGEMNNLAVDPEHNEVLQLHRTYLKEWLSETNDKFRMPDEILN
ncbi:MAG TPA: sulfatase-like hydrolase/transferase [Bacteroidales bacterium]|nr:sulfatase-like hydrolase/transferase [Bacteroidales bacterium]